MHAAILRAGQLVLDTLPDPIPGPGEVLVRTLACGICGSDLHAHGHTAAFVAAMREQGGPELSLDADLVLGHEFCAELLDHGPNTRRTLAPGTRVCSMPVVLRAERLQHVGFSNRIPGGLAERMVLSESLLLPVPAGVPAELAALTEPLAVGVRAVEQGQLDARDVSLVLGCGPVGLAVILALKARGLGPVVAADPSPMRRAMAERMGADEIVDPGADSAYDALRRASREGAARTAGEPMATLFGRSAGRPTVIFECVGLPGMLGEVVQNAPAGTRVVVVGACVEPDAFKPLVALGKELELRFILAYSAAQFESALRFIAEGSVDLSPMVTRQVQLDGVAEAFEALQRPQNDVKIVVRPS